jgi:hypothetical protein
MVEEALRFQTPPAPAAASGSTCNATPHADPFLITPRTLGLGSWIIDRIDVRWVVSSSEPLPWKRGDPMVKIFARLATHDRATQGALLPSASSTATRFSERRWLKAAGSRAVQAGRPHYHCTPYGIHTSRRLPALFSWDLTRPPSNSSPGGREQCAHRRGGGANALSELVRRRRAIAGALREVSPPSWR